MAKNNDDEAKLAAMRARQQAADDAEKIANAEKLARQAMEYQRQAKREQGNGKR
jgi:hypothetical protein